MGAPPTSVVFPSLPTDEEFPDVSDDDEESDVLPAIGHDEGYSHHAHDIDAPLLDPYYLFGMGEGEPDS